MTKPPPQPFVVWTDASGARGYLHGTKVDLKVGDLLEVGRPSNFGDRAAAKFIYFTETLDAATWGAELAVGQGPGRIYLVEPTGPIEDDPNLTDKKFPGNPTRSFRSRAPLRVVGEVVEWTGHPPEQVQKMKDAVASVTARGERAIED
jgi:rifampin ADP-ribosylating transferase